MNYRKLDVAMLDSTIWLEDVPTRIVWLTLLLSMNQEYVAEFSSVRNLAKRANVTEKEAVKAVAVLESPDPESHSKREEGRRIVRVDGGWFVVNGDLYQEWALIELAKKKNRERVQRHRENKTLQVTNGTDVTITSVTHPITQEIHRYSYKDLISTSLNPEKSNFNATEAAMGYCHRFSIVGQIHYDLIRQAIELEKRDPQTVANEMIAAREKYESLSGKKFEYEPLNFIVKGVWKYPQRWLGKPKQKTLEEIIDESIRRK